jgi:hypothetical protein
VDHPVGAEATEREFHRMGFADDRAMLTTDAVDDQPLPLPFRRQPPRRPGVAGQSCDAIQILDRDRNALKRPGIPTGRKGAIGLPGAGER